MNPLRTALAGIIHDNPRHRDHAVEYLGDLLRGTFLDEADAVTAVSHLVTLLTTETDPTVQEAALNAIGEAFDHHRLGLRLFQPLLALLDAMPTTLLDHALMILAATHDPGARPTIETFLDHPNVAVRASAAEALIELPGRTVP
ncbi:HEAT repeat domain-containing protein [Nocardia sp. CC227C]|uniref:HEAT repeat domain-containing protein n=1 Tax=Nocardia sp. CC227C TaxID=3044562 RepID=UPI00278BD772|nr:HEAT repeat domain-containing protein [Nocardia sp. CC227C]